MIESSLVTGPEWIATILAGQNIWEARSKPNARIGRIALAGKSVAIVRTDAMYRADAAAARKGDR